MKRIITEIEINASPERVWQVLTDFSALSQWNPFLRSAEGKLQVGERLKLYIKGSKGMGMKFKPTVLKADPNVELRWIGRLLIPGIFDGEHYFTMEPVGDGRTLFVQSENFSGLLVPLFAIMGVIKNTRFGFEEMNAALKLRAESLPGR